ncbi:hypothetical protein XENOCAPTIV_030860, partial [Xenoophorus captivus]
MPGERLTIRKPSEVGRFPGAAAPTRVELTIQSEGGKKQEEGACRRWFRKICPCCCKRQNSASYDVTDKVEFTKPPAPAVVTTPEPDKSKPENGEMKETEGTHVIIPLVDSLKDERWEAKITEQKCNKIRLSVNSPADAVIGLYGLTVTTQSAKDEEPTVYNSSENIIMLYNPWCEGKLGLGRKTAKGFT